MKLTQTKSIFETIRKYRKTHTLAQTGQKFDLSSERVRQICLGTYMKRCKIHNRLYYNECSFCLTRSYTKYVSKLSCEDLIKETKKEAKNKKRDYLSVFRRMFLIYTLRDFYGMSFVDISNLLDKDYSTVIHLYNKHE